MFLLKTLDICSSLATENITFGRIYLSNQFGTLVSPILTYAMAANFGELTQNKTLSRGDKDPTEKMHLRFCKFYLGINSLKVFKLCLHS